MIRTFRFAQHCWEAIKKPEHPRVIELRVSATMYCSYLIRNVPICSYCTVYNYFCTQRAYAARLSKSPAVSEQLLENTKSTDGAAEIREASAVEVFIKGPTCPYSYSYSHI